MFWISPEMAEAIAGLQTTVSGTEDPTWNAWLEAMQQYAQASNSSGLTRTNFWLVVGIPKKDFSEKIEWHEEIPMLMPASGVGKLIGLAQTKDDLNKIIEADQGNVHLTYKVKIQGQKAWRDLVEFLAQHDMLEKE